MPGDLLQDLLEDLLQDLLYEMERTCGKIAFSAFCRVEEVDR